MALGFWGNLLWDHSDEALWYTGVSLGPGGEVGGAPHPEESGGWGERLPWALWEHFPRVAFIHLSGEMLNISQDFLSPLKYSGQVYGLDLDVYQWYILYKP